MAVVAALRGKDGDRARGGLTQKWEKREAKNDSFGRSGDGEFYGESYLSDPT